MKHHRFHTLASSDQDKMEHKRTEPIREEIPSTDDLVCTAQLSSLLSFEGPHNTCLWILRRVGEEHESSPCFQQDLQEYFHQDPLPQIFSPGIFPPRTFYILSLSPYFFRNISFPSGFFFTRNFYRQGIFLPGIFFSAKIFSLWIFSAMICRLQEMSLNFTRSLTFCRHGREYFSSHNEKGQNDRSAIWSGRELQAIPVLVQQARRQAGARIRSVLGAEGDNFCF